MKMVKRPAETAAQVKVRMPKQLQRTIERAADESGQTINAEILRRLESGYQSDALVAGLLDADSAPLLRVIAQAMYLARDWPGDRSKTLPIAIKTIVDTYFGVSLPPAETEEEKFGRDLADVALVLGGFRRAVTERSRISTNEPHELYYVARKYGVSVDAVRRVIQRVGNTRNKVRAVLDKTDNEGASKNERSGTQAKE
jgi:uncharacterized protein DUF3606/Arc-like DNA binding dprotein